MAPKAAEAVAIATCTEVAGKDNDDLLVISALRNRGIEATHAVWDDPGVDWTSFGLVVVRSTWDYSDRRDEFLAWARQPRALLNPFSVIQWNTDKHYLNDLARAGLPVVPTRYVEPGDVFEPPDGPIVVKPTVSCGAKDTAWYAAADVASAREHIDQLHAGGRTAMIQPYLANIEATGEVSLMFIGGDYSHSICRDPSLKRSGAPDDASTIPLSVDVYDNVRSYKPTSDERALAERVMSHLKRISSDLLYARIDLIPGPDGEPIILEIELTEPTLFLHGHSAHGVERLADSIASAALKK